jgi:hypothetical protein
MDSPPDVVNNFEAWAAVSARLFDVSEDEHLAILQELGIAAVWDNADAGWAKAVVADIGDMHLDRIEHLGGAYACQLAKRDSATRVNQIGGTPFSSDPLDRAPTKKMRVKDLEDHLKKTKKK